MGVQHHKSHERDQDGEKTLQVQYNCEVWKVWRMVVCLGRNGRSRDVCGGDVGVIRE